ncbi:unnamed protein product [Arctogadus glacialis]
MSEPARERVHSKKAGIRAAVILIGLLHKSRRAKERERERDREREKEKEQEGERLVHLCPSVCKCVYVCVYWGGAVLGQGREAGYAHVYAAVSDKGFLREL